MRKALGPAQRGLTLGLSPRQALRKASTLPPLLAPFLFVKELLPTYLEPARAGTVRERLLRAPVLAEVLTSMATAWDPDFAMASSSEMVDLVEKRKREVRVGWLTYLSRRLGTLPPLPAPVRIEPVGALGWLLILSPEPMTASNPEHVAFTERVRALLDQAGLIEIPEPERPDSEPLDE